CAIVGFDATGYGSSSGSTIGHEVVSRMRFVKSDMSKTLEDRFIVIHVHRTGDLRKTHSIANEEDDIFRFDIARTGLTGCGMASRLARRRQDEHCEYRQAK